MKWWAIARDLQGDHIKGKKNPLDITAQKLLIVDLSQTIERNDRSKSLFTVIMNGQSNKTTLLETGLWQNARTEIKVKVCFVFPKMEDTETCSTANDKGTIDVNIENISSN